MGAHWSRQWLPCSPEALAPAAPPQSQFPQPSPWIPTFQSPGSTRHGMVGKVLSRVYGSILEHERMGTEELRVRTALGWLHAGTWGDIQHGLSSPFHALHRE